MSSILFATSTYHAQQLAKQAKQGVIRRIYPGIYTSDISAPVESIVRNEWLSIAVKLVSKGVLAYRTAIELQPTVFSGQNVVFFIGSYAKTITLPGLIIKVSKGNFQDHTENVLPNLLRTSLPRSLLENLQPNRGHRELSVRGLGAQGVEAHLAKLLHVHQENHLRELRQQAHQISKKLGYDKEYKQLDAIIETLLATRADSYELTSDYAQALAKGENFDLERINLFNSLAVYLQQCTFLSREYQYSSSTFKNIAFFEAYFSNYIEGTEFVIDEAEDIIFKGQEVYDRHADSHDVLASYQLTSDYSQISEVPTTADEFIDLLKSRHAFLMRERLDVNPGIFKDRANKAGNTFLVMPENVIGTLCHGFKNIVNLEPGLMRALYMHFLVAEVHPFKDGNGRLARIMMNAELVCAERYKIIIPTVHRDNYLNGLRLASRDKIFKTYCKVMDQAQAYTATLDWQNYADVREKIEEDYADQYSDEGIPIFNRALRQLKLSLYAD